MKTFESYLEEQETPTESGRCQHVLQSHEKKSHAQYMKKMHGVKTKFYSNGECSYHGPRKNVKKAVLNHYGPNNGDAEDNHPHLFGRLRDWEKKQKDATNN